MKKILLTLVALLSCTAAVAAPAKPEPFAHVQSDGQTVTLMMRGGEFHHAITTRDGLTVARDMNGDYCYMAGGMLSTVVAHDQADRGIRETAFVTAYRDQMTLAADAQGRKAPRRDGENDNPQVPTTGSPRIPIILASYADVAFVDADPVATFQNQFNVMDKSCLHYFQDQSRGRFSPQFDILGPVSLPQPREYYGANVRRYNNDLDEQLGTMIYDACMGVEQDVDFSQYDNDGDGNVDVVVVLYAGVGEAQAWRYVPESVWPCQWDMQESLDWGCSVTGPFELDGVTIDRYAVFNELEGSNNSSTTVDGIGTFCHEFGHCLGLPDFYATNGASYYGMSTWDIMDNGCYLDGGHTPVGYTSYERHFMGWMDLTEAEPGTEYTLAPLNTDEGNAVRVTNDANPDEYYLLEYRTRTGWDAYIAGEGIMVLHVDYDAEAWEANVPNNNAAHPRMTLIPADNILSGGTNRNDLWPYGQHDALTDESVPAARVYAGGLMHKPITAMTVDASVPSASFRFMWPKEIPGDVNQDGEVTIADAATVIDALLAAEDNMRCDVNQDGEVTLADVNAVIDLILQ